MTARTIWELLRRTTQEFLDDKAMRLAAALAFYTALSIAPLLLVVVSVVGFVYGEKAAQGQLHAQLQNLVGPRAAGTVESLLASSSPEHGGAWAGTIGLVTLLVGATGVFSQLQDALNTVWDIEEEKNPPGGIWRMVLDRLLSFAMVCAAALLLLASLITSAVVSGIGDMAAEWLGIGAGWLRFTDTLVSLAVTFAMFAMIFKVLPYKRPRWHDVWIGAAITTLLFAVGKYLIGLYLGRAAVGSTFGAAGSFVVLLMWLYYSSLIFLFGAEFTQVYANRDRPTKARDRTPGSAAARPAEATATGPSGGKAPLKIDAGGHRPAAVPAAQVPEETAFANSKPSSARVLLIVGLAVISHVLGALRRADSSTGRKNGHETHRRMARRGTPYEHARDPVEPGYIRGERCSSPLPAEEGDRSRSRGT